MKKLTTFNIYTSEAFISNSALLKLMDEGTCPANIYKDNDGKDVYVPVRTEESGLHEQDDDRVKIVITPPTGETQSTTNYMLTGVVVLVALGITVMFIKKKRLTK